ncbi:hypothetical protein MIMGU_mgv11b016592mg [Erythranthe guttata]|uniref:Uncharacterized protein n=1 Tax=Erythranthe guttata TaxID=4155 RepID=A0A022QVC4_ERYGU|nr:hypothetical protein MIMGU_mgv11b016592mg [Erythranthe guttata]
MNQPKVKRGIGKYEIGRTIGSIDCYRRKFRSLASILFSVDDSSIGFGAPVWANMRTRGVTSATVTSYFLETVSIQRELELVGTPSVSRFGKTAKALLIRHPSGYGCRLNSVTPYSVINFFLFRTFDVQFLVRLWRPAFALKLFMVHCRMCARSMNEL